MQNLTSKCHNYCSTNTPRVKWWSNSNDEYSQFKYYNESCTKYTKQLNGWIDTSYYDYDPSTIEYCSESTPSTLNRARKVKLRPNPKERKLLKKWFAIHKYLYNKAVEYAKNNRGLTKAQLVQEIRKRYITTSSSDLEVPPWLTLDEYKEYPYAFRDDAVQDLKKALTTEWSKWSKDNSHTFEFKFRRKKDYTQSMNIPLANWNSKGKAYGWLHAIKHKAEIPKDLDNGIKLFWDKRIDTFYIIYVTHPELKKITPKFKAVSIDPGVRTFATTYNTSGGFSEYCTSNDSLDRICRRIDRLKSIIDGNKGNKHRLRRVILRLYAKLRNKTRHLHYTVAKDLCLFHEHILLPEFKSSNMVERPRIIGRKTAREMLTYSHYSFQQRLKSKVEEHPNVKLHIVTEEYTTKYCGSCGTLNDIGSSKVYNCSSCNYTCDRDLNAARNIMLKNHGLLC